MIRQVIIKLVDTSQSEPEGPESSDISSASRTRTLQHPKSNKALSPDMPG